MLQTCKIRFPKIAAEFEALFLENKTLFLNSSLGNHIQIKNPPRFSKLFFELCENDYSTEDFLNYFDKAERNKVILLINKLFDLGVLVENLSKTLNNRISTEIYSRYKTEIEYFRTFNNDSDQALEAFIKLRNSKVSIVGAGGNGSVIAMMLAAAGVGELHIIDGDTVDESNLLRQLFYTENDAKQKKMKVDALKHRITELTTYTKVTTKAKYINNESDLNDEFLDSDFVVLAADMPRFKINKWVNSVCFQHRIPNINAFSGIIGPLVIPGKSYCFNCFENMYRRNTGDLYDQIIESLQKPRNYQYPSFVSGVVELAALQANEVINYLTGITSPKTINAILRNDSGFFTKEMLQPIDTCNRCRDLFEKNHVQEI